LVDLHRRLIATRIGSDKETQRDVARFTLLSMDMQGDSSHAWIRTQFFAIPNKACPGAG
jgi:hypothetical protein